jgi:hypothetical protein
MTAAKSPDGAHKFLPYPNGRTTSCVRCGMPEQSPVHDESLTSDVLAHAERQAAAMPARSDG